MGLEGDGRLSHVTWASEATGEKPRFATEHLFVMIGADPCTNWLHDCVDFDSNGFVQTSSGSAERGPFGPWVSITSGFIPATMISVFALAHFDYGPIPFGVPKMSATVFVRTDIRNRPIGETSAYFGTLGRRDLGAGHSV